jgi:hypothetical protein
MSQLAISGRIPELPLAIMGCYPTLNDLLEVRLTSQQVVQFSEVRCSRG